MIECSTEKIAWAWQGDRVRIGVTRLGSGPAVLLLPALSSISTRHEMRQVQERLADRFSTIAIDWPGFGDLPRPALAWSPDAYDDFLAHLLADVVPAPHATVAAGHGAGFALRRAAAAPGSGGRLCLVAPTWRGPLPAMAGRRHPAFAQVAAAGDWPVIGAALYRLNVNRPVMNMMVRGHVYADPGWLDEVRTAEKLAVIRAPGARHASIRFVTGQLDPFADREGFLGAARRAVELDPGSCRPGRRLAAEIARRDAGPRRRSGRARGRPAARQAVRARGVCGGDGRGRRRFPVGTGRSQLRPNRGQATARPGRTRRGKLMLEVLGNRTYRHLFAAQVLSLIGTGLTTVALGLLAYELAGADAGAVLGTALALKMTAYVCLAPVAGALADLLPRRPFLVALDLVRAAMVLFLPFVSEIWQVYLLVFLFQACSAAFTPTFQATIPDVLPEERDYTRALSLSRLAYDLESVASPLLAGVLLTIVSFNWLFVGNALGFLASAALVISVALPAVRRDEERPFLRRLTRGAWIYLATPRLRGLLALNLVVAAAGAMVIVNTVVVVRAGFGGSDRDVALFFAAYGAGSMAVALSLPRLLDRVEARPVMLAGGALLSIALVLGTLAPAYGPALALWAAIGAGASLVQTPSGLLLRRSSHAEDRPALFAAQFALSHACWLVAYPAAGWLGAGIGLGATFAIMGAAAAAGALAAALLWPRHDPEEIPHVHTEIEHVHGPADDPHHLPDAVAWRDPRSGRHRHRRIRHAHRFVIDDHHPAWPG